MPFDPSDPRIQKPQPAPPRTPRPPRTPPIPSANGWLIWALSLLFALAATGLFSLILNLVLRGDFALFAPDRLTLPASILNAAIFFAAFGLIFALTNRWVFSAALLSGITLITIAADILKEKITDVPLTPMDLCRSLQFFASFPHLGFGLQAAVVVLALAAAALLVFLFKLRRARFLRAGRFCRLLTLAAALAILGGIASYGFKILDPNTAALIQWNHTNQKQNYEQNGFFLASAVGSLYLINPIPPPPDYSADTVAKILKPAVPAPSTPAAAEPANVIVIQAEAFWDVQKLGVKMTSDPIPFFHDLQKKSVSGYIHSPIYGAYTPKMEFEVLTGCSMDYLPGVANPYSSYINLARDLPALPRVFKANHYRTVAIHPNYNYVWDRSAAYPLLGFDQFFDFADFKKPRMSGPYVSDEALFDKIVEITTQTTPCFVYGVTIATHYPYTYPDFLKAPLDVTTTLTAESHALLKTYINAISHTDAALKRMIAKLSAEKKKTLVVFFGDRLPLLGEDLGIYKELKYFRPGDDFNIRMHLTPIVVWANYPLPPLNVSREACLLYPYVLTAAGLPLDAYAQFLENIARQAPYAQSLNAAGEANYRAIEYDILFGRQYALRGTGIPPVIPPTPAAARPTATLAPTPSPTLAPMLSGPVIEIKNFGPQGSGITPGKKFNEQPDGSSAFWFTTSKATSNTVVMLNEKALPTTVDPAGTFVSALLGKDEVLKAGTYQIRLVDRKSGAHSKELPLVVGGPAPAPASTPAPAPVSHAATSATLAALPPPQVKSWGAQFTTAGVSFNPQPTGGSALWFILERPIMNPTVFFGATALETHANGNTISAEVPPFLYAESGDYPIVIVDNHTGKKSAAMIFKVKDAPIR